ncbi:MAG: copper-binding protein [Bryobacteraceae bacterium]|jgi:Cu/Ag efflux protein CusF
MHRRQCVGMVLFLAAACTARREPKFDYGEPKQRYTLRGKVLRLRPEARIAVIDHEKIEGWMEAMTMEFPVPKEEDFAKLKEGVVIRATVNVNDLHYWLTGIELE